MKKILSILFIAISFNVFSQGINYSPLPAPIGSSNGQVVYALEGGLVTNDSLAKIDSLMYRNNENGAGSKVASVWQKPQVFYGKTSTVSGVDTVFLTTTGDNDGVAIFKDANYEVIIGEPNSDSTSYAYTITKAQKYVRVLCRSANDIYNWALCSDATEVKILCIGDGKQ